MNSLYFNVSDKFANFSSLQPLESQALAGIDAVGQALSQVDWFIEVAPVTSPSPTLKTQAKRQKVLVSADQTVWPFSGQLDALPIDSNAVPALLLRHTWQLPIDPLGLAQWVRVLKPGGWWVAVSANPWHPSVWRRLGRRCFGLPSWPHLVWAHRQAGIELDITPFGRGPKLSPILVLVGRKRSAVAPIRPKARQLLATKAPPAVATSCRAA